MQRHLMKYYRRRTVFSVSILMYCDYRAYSHFAYKSFGGTTMQASCLYKRILICEALLAFYF